MPRVLVIIHIYYSNQVDLILDKLRNITLPYDLYCSIGNQKEREGIKTRILKVNQNAHIVDIANVGYDVWPFIHIINSVDLSNYAYIVKLHTKRDIDENRLMELGNGFCVGPGDHWRNNLYAFVSTKENFNKCIAALKDPKVGMCARFNIIHNAPNHCGVIDYAKTYYPQYMPDIDSYSFVAGTMFVAKTEPFQMLKDMNINEQLFKKPTTIHETQFAHVVERTIGAAIYKSGMVIIDPFTEQTHIKKIIRLYRRRKWIKRIINYLGFLIPVPKIRRKIKDKLFALLYTPYEKYIIHFDDTNTENDNSITPIKKNLGFDDMLLQIRFCFNKNKRHAAQEKLLARKLLTKKLYKIPAGFDWTKIPVFIISYNQLSYVKQIVGWLKDYGFTNIHIVDNKSTYKPLLDYLDDVDCYVHHMDKNYGHTVIWSSGKFDDIINRQCYIVSDCDIAPNPNLPKDFVCKLYELLGKYPYLTKIGFALNIADLPETETNKIVKQWESKFWNKEIDNNIYLADIDTTFALYRPGKLVMNTKRFYYAIRVAGDMTAIHLPWFETKDTDESLFYRKTANSSASWTKNVAYYANETN